MPTSLPSKSKPGSVKTAALILKFVRAWWMGTGLAFLWVALPQVLFASVALFGVCCYICIRHEAAKDIDP